MKGEDETRRQIFLYSLVLFGTTLLLVPDRPHGAGLPGRRRSCWAASFVWRALRLWRERRRRTERGALFKYSIVYLAALFGAVAVDALSPFGR